MKRKIANRILATAVSAAMLLSMAAPVAFAEDADASSETTAASSEAGAESAAPAESAAEAASSEAQPEEDAVSSASESSSEAVPEAESQPVASVAAPQSEDAPAPAAVPSFTVVYSTGNGDNEDASFTFAATDNTIPAPPTPEDTTGQNRPFLGWKLTSGISDLHGQSYATVQDTYSLVLAALGSETNAAGFTGYTDDGILKFAADWGAPVAPEEARPILAVYYSDLSDMLDADALPFAADETTFESGNSLYAPTDIPTRDGYTFNGWMTTSGISYREVAAAFSNASTDTEVLDFIFDYANYDAGTPRLVFVPDWQESTQKTTVTVMFHDDLSTVIDGSLPDDHGSSTFFTDKTLYANANVPTRDGYTFNGWMTAGNNKAPVSYETVAADYATVTDDASMNAFLSKYAEGYPCAEPVIIFVADWKTATASLPLNVIYYNNLSQLLANDLPSAAGVSTFLSGDTLFQDSTAPTRDGYTFKGWVAASGAGLCSYEDIAADYAAITDDLGILEFLGKYADENGNLIFLADWEKTVVQPKVTVVYHSDVADFLDGNLPDDVAENSFFSGETLFATEKVPTRDDATFKGWITTSGATYDEVAKAFADVKDDTGLIDFLYQYTDTSSDSQPTITFIADWDIPAEMPNVIVRYYNDLESLLAGEAPVAEYDDAFAAGGVLSAYNPENPPKRDGYTFKNWITATGTATTSYDEVAKAFATVSDSSSLLDFLDEYADVSSGVPVISFVADWDELTVQPYVIVNYWDSFDSFWNHCVGAPSDPKASYNTKFMTNSILDKTDYVPTLSGWVFTNWINPNSTDSSYTYQQVADAYASIKTDEDFLNFVAKYADSSSGEPVINFIPDFSSVLFNVLYYSSEEDAQNGAAPFAILPVTENVVSLPQPNKTPEKNGYTFTGWKKYASTIPASHAKSRPDVQLLSSVNSAFESSVASDDVVDVFIPDHAVAGGKEKLYSASYISFVPVYTANASATVSTSTATGDAHPEIGQAIKDGTWGKPTGNQTVTVNNTTTGTAPKAAAAATTTIPQTSDSMNLTMWVLLFWSSLAGMAAMLFFKKCGFTRYN